MDKETLLAFIQRILENSSLHKSTMALNQLAMILEGQNADPEMVRLVRRAVDGEWEAKEMAKEQGLTEEALNIAWQRAEDRRRREAAAARQGRC